MSNLKFPSSFERYKMSEAIAKMQAQKEIKPSKVKRVKYVERSSSESDSDSDCHRHHHRRRRRRHHCCPPPPPICDPCCNYFQPPLCLPPLPVACCPPIFPYSQCPLPCQQQFFYY